jgi:DNA-binding transcriptional ArsR family regulator
MQVRRRTPSRRAAASCHERGVDEQSARSGKRLSPEVIELTAERLRVVAEPNRIGIMAALNEGGEATVQELAECLGAPHQRVSKHLAVLHYTGIVSRRRGEGTPVLYKLIDWSGWWVIEQIAGWVGSGLEKEGGGAAEGRAPSP